MTVPESFVQKKLKIRIGSKGVSREYCPEVITYTDRSDNVSVHRNDKLDMNRNMKLKLSYQDQSKKRGPVTILDNQMKKRRTMDRGMNQQCAKMLKDLKNHRYAWPFKDPVDPVALNIPDYFSIVKNPMDLGTIELKLEKNVYFSADEFASDVRLVFSNCMMYNPPHNQYHGMARELNNYFGSRWKLVEKKLRLDSIDSPLRRISSGYREETKGRISLDHKAYPSKVSSVNRRAMPVEEKQKVVKDLKNLLKGKITVKLQSFLKKYNLCSLKERIDMDVGSLDDEVLWELKRITNNLLKATAGKIEAAKVTQGNAHPLSDKDTERGIDDVSRVCCSLEKVKPPASSMKHPGQRGDCRTDGYLENMATSCSGRSNTIENGSGSVVEEAACGSHDSSICCSMDMTDEGCAPSIDIHMSPKKALRAAMLKSRFADTIFKARHNTLLEQGDKGDPVKLQWEKDKLEKQHREEKLRIEAQIVAAEAASRLRAHSELKMQREREREAARLALEQMERTVDFVDNLKFLRDLELMSRCSSEYRCKLFGGRGNPLERLGLFFKLDYVQDDDDVEVAPADIKDRCDEGEIVN